MGQKQTVKPLNCVVLMQRNQHLLLETRVELAPQSDPPDLTAQQDTVQTVHHPITRRGAFTINTDPSYMKL